MEQLFQFQYKQTKLYPSKPYCFVLTIAKHEVYSHLRNETLTNSGETFLLEILANEETSSLMIEKVDDEASEARFSG